MTGIIHLWYHNLHERNHIMPNKRSPNKEGVAISVEKSLKAKWQKEAAEMGLTLTDYIILKCEQNYERANNHTKQNNAKSKRDGE